MSYNASFYWPAGPENVIVTGSFDNWSQSLPLVKTSKGDFEITFPLKPENGEDKVLFKFVVDGEWVTSDNYETENDGGNINNVVYYSNLAAAASKETGSKIPEAGGLVAASSGKENLNTTVLPSDEGKQTTLGEPGIAVPSEPHKISAFSEVSNVDAKDLNKKIKAEEAAEEAAAAATTNGVDTTVLPSDEGKQVTTGEPGIAVPENAANIKEFSEVSNVDPKELNEQIKAEEAAGEEAKTKTVKVKKVIKRNKITGEEIVVSSEPVEEDVAQTLDPKENGEAKSEEAAKTVEKPSAVPAKKETPAPTAVKTEEKKKGGFFRKLKKFL